MTFSIEPDLTFQKVGALGGRKDNSKVSSEAGQEFSRFLAEDTDTAAQGMAEQVPTASSRKAPDTEGPAASPLLQGDAAQGDLLAGPVQDNGEVLLAATEPRIDVQERLTAKAGQDKADTIESEDVADANDAEVLLAPISSPAQSEPAPAPEHLADSTTDAPPDQAELKTAGANTDTTAAAPPEAQAILVQATNPDAVKASTSRTADTAQKTGAAAAISSVPASAPAAVAGTPQPASGKPEAVLTNAKSEAPVLPQSEAGTRQAADTADLTTGISTADAKPAAGHAPAPDVTFLAAASAVSQAPASQPAQTQQIQMAPTNALIVASPAETVKIIAGTIDGPDDTPDRITVRLDPPELGRVSIDFKFDSHGLQHVTVTGENPEALRQLRLMHFELTQALERSGLSSENMTFQQQQSGQQQAQSSPARSLFATQDAADTSNLTSLIPAPRPAQPPRTAGGGLNIRL